MSSATLAAPADPAEAAAAQVSRAPGTAGGERIAAAFARAAADGRAAFIPYAVAGYPDAARAEAVALALIDGGADLVEIGLPYSDPLADGATLQRAARAALDAGATLDRSVELVTRIRAARPDVPLIAMGYVNQVVGGKDGASVLERLGAAGVAGLILADLTPDEGGELEARAASHGMSIIYLVTPTTTPARLRMIAERSGYVLQGADAHLERARLAMARNELATARDHAQQARTLATCDGPPDYTYKAAYDEAGALLKQLG